MGFFVRQMKQLLSTIGKQDPDRLAILNSFANQADTMELLLDLIRVQHLHPTRTAILQNEESSPDHGQLRARAVIGQCKELSEAIDAEFALLLMARKRNFLQAEKEPSVTLLSQDWEVVQKEQQKQVQSGKDK